MSRPTRAAVFQMPEFDELGQEDAVPTEEQEMEQADAEPAAADEVTVPAADDAVDPAPVADDVAVSAADGAVEPEPRAPALASIWMPRPKPQPRQRRPRGSIGMAASAATAEERLEGKAAPAASTPAAAPLYRRLRRGAPGAAAAPAVEAPAAGAPADEAPLPPWKRLKSAGAGGVHSTSTRVYAPRRREAPWRHHGD